MNIIEELLQKYKKLHFSLIDPDRQTPEEAGRRAKICEGYGTNAIMVGGSTVKDRSIVYDTVKVIKESVEVPTILFPNSADIIPENVNHIFFLRLLNSKEKKYLIDEQVRGTPIVKKWNIEPISTGYIVMSTSKRPTTIEKNVKLHKIQINDIEKAVEYSVYAETLGMFCVYLEAGSDAERPISNEMLQAIRSEISLPIIVGGGIKNGDMTKEKVDAGADIIVNGTATEGNIKIIEEIVKKIRLLTSSI